MYPQSLKVQRVCCFLSYFAAGEICDGGVASLTSSSQEMVMLVGIYFSA